MATVLDHVDGVPIGLVDDAVDGKGGAGDAHVGLDQGADAVPAAAVVAAEEGPPHGQGRFNPRFLFAEGLVEFLAGESLPRQGLAFFLECHLDAVRLDGRAIDGVDGEDASQHDADADRNQQQIDAAAEHGGRIVDGSVGSGHGWA